MNSFNTQPPEGGCGQKAATALRTNKFQHTAARRRLPFFNFASFTIGKSFNTQPPEGGCKKI